MTGEEGIKVFAAFMTQFVGLFPNVGQLPEAAETILHEGAAMSAARGEREALEARNRELRRENEGLEVNNRKQRREIEAAKPEHLQLKHAGRLDVVIAEKEARVSGLDAEIAAKEQSLATVVEKFEVFKREHGLA